MSSSVGYYVSAADIEAQRKRQLRGDLAATLARYADMRAHARSIGLNLPAVAGAKRMDDNATIDELERLLECASDALADANESIDARWSERWRANIGKVTKGATVTEVSAGEELARRRPDPVQDNGSLRGAIDDAAVLLSGNGHRCDQEGLVAASAVYEELVTVTSVQRARALSLEVAVLISESIKRRAHAVAQEEQRVRLLQLVDEAPPSEQEALRALVTSARDLDDVEDTVHQAVERADLWRHRQKVADATAAALAELDCVVGEEFESLLLNETQAVVAFADERRGYGLLVRLPEDGGRLFTAVVRAEEEPSEGSRAAAVQAQYCSETLPQLDTALREQGVQLDATPFLQRLPGTPIPVAPAALPRTTRARKPAKPASTSVTEVRHRAR